jgi:hypothetical protein
MPHLGLDVFDVLALIDQQAGIGVPHIMKANNGQLCPFRCGVEKSTHDGVVKRFSGLAWKDERKIRLWANQGPLAQHGRQFRPNIRKPI